MTHGPRSRWWKFYTTLVEDKLHYTDAQFRAFVTLISKGEELPPYGVLPKLPAIRALVGSENVDFLIAQGDLDVSGDRPFVTGRDVYQKPPDPTAAERQRRHRQQVDNVVDNALPDARHDHVTRDSRRDPLPSTSSSDSYDEERSPSTSDGSFDAANADIDALDRFHELTQSRPWGKRSGAWLLELQATHGIPNVIAALEVENRDHPADPKLLSKVAARLERQADRVEQARRREPKPVDPVQAQLREALRSTETADPVVVAPEPDPEAVAAGRAAWAALRGNLRGSSHRPERVIPSRNGGQGQPLTDVGTPGSPAPTRGSERGTPSPRATAVRPSASGPPNASTDEAIQGVHE